jgi:hypothetical protein
MLILRRVVVVRMPFRTYIFNSFRYFRFNVSLLSPPLADLAVAGETNRKMIKLLTRPYTTPEPLSIAFGEFPFRINDSPLQLRERTRIRDAKRRIHRSYDLVVESVCYFAGSYGTELASIYEAI